MLLRGSCTSTKKIMHYIVLDLEWNIPRDRSKADPGLLREIPEEIIEIGAIRLKEDFRPAGRFSIDVKPRYYKTMHRYISGLTQRADESLRHGSAFPQAAERFFAWVEEESTEYLFCTWSNSDSSPWQNNLRHYGLLPEHQPLFLDVQRLYGLAHEELSTQRSIAHALETLEIPLVEPFHKAVNDASYTARILAKTVDMLRSSDQLPSGAEAVYRQLSRYAYDPAIRYRVKLDLGTVEQPNALDMILDNYPWTCPACEHLLEKPVWKKKRRGLSRQAKVRCPEHGEIILKTQTYRQAHAEPESPWIVKADIHLQRPL